MSGGIATEKDEKEMVNSLVVDAAFFAFPEHNQIWIRIREAVNASFDTAKALMSFLTRRPLRLVAFVVASLAVVTVFVKTKMSAHKALVVIVWSGRSRLQERECDKRKSDQRASHHDRRRMEETKSSRKVVLMKD